MKEALGIGGGEDDLKLGPRGQCRAAQSREATDQGRFLNSLCCATLPYSTAMQPVNACNLTLTAIHCQTSRPRYHRPHLA